jgi:large subunit ribosomal protein L27
MAHRKAESSSKNLRTSNPKYLGVKLYDGEKAAPGMVIVRQRGTKIMAGKNVKVGTDHTLFAMAEGLVKFADRRKKNFDGTSSVRKTVSVVAA